MEIRAPYVLIGGFVLAVIAAGFGFVYWLHNAGSLTERTTYRIHFENTVSGLLTGAAVLFNGIRVGEVTALELDRQQSQPRDGDNRRSRKYAGARRHQSRPGFSGSDRRPRGHAAGRQQAAERHPRAAGHADRRSARRAKHDHCSARRVAAT